MNFNLPFTTVNQDGVSVPEQQVLKPAAMKRYLKNIEMGYKMANELSVLCQHPEKGEQYVIVTEKQFNAFALVLSLVQDRIIDELYFAIYRINQPTVDALIQFIQDGRIKKGGFVISNFFNQTKKPERWALKLVDFCDNNRSFDCVYVHNHAKVLCLKEQDNYFVFEGSGNMSDNARIEQYRYENCRETFDFHKKWMVELWREDQKQI